MYYKIVANTLILYYVYVKISMLIAIVGGVNMKTLFLVLIIASSLVLIASVLLQSGKSAGLSGSISGGAETIWGKNKGRGYESILARLTTVSAALFIISALILTAIK